MKQEDLKLLAKDAVREEDLRAREIPSIDLYVDQILNLVAEKQKEGSERYYDRQLTKTMINNYSKDGLITPVKGKKYTKEQIVQILTIYTLKNTISIGEIKRLLDGAYAIDGFGGEDLVALYDRYLSIKDQNRDYALEILDDLMRRSELDVSDEKDMMRTVGSLLSLSAFLKDIAQAMIDAAYPEPEPVDEKKEKEAAAEKEKAEKAEKKAEKVEKEKAEKAEKEKAKKEKKEKKDKKESAEAPSEE